MEPSLLFYYKFILIELLLATEANLSSSADFLCNHALCYRRKI